MEFVINQYLVAWTCRGMCGTNLKNRRAWSSVSDSVVSCSVVSCMCELDFRVIYHA